MIFEEETYVIRGAVFEVYKEMGCGFLEAVYQTEQPIWMLVLMLTFMSPDIFRGKQILMEQHIVLSVAHEIFLFVN